MSTVTQRGDRAGRFFWGVLAAATASSVAGNVTHAVTNPAAGNAIVAGLAAVVPPAVLLAATHGLALMVRTSIGGRLYRCALALTVALGGCAFVLSYHSLYALAVESAGMPAAIAWLWPLAIDLSIAQSTLALLAQTGARRAAGAPVHAAIGAHDAPQRTDTPVAPDTGALLAQTGARVHAAIGAPGAPQRADAPTHAPVAPDTGATVHVLRAPTPDAPADAPVDWFELADALLAQRVTRVERGKLAVVLAELAKGTAPSTIAREVGVGYATIGRLSAHLDAA